LVLHYKRVWFCLLKYILSNTLMTRSLVLLSWQINICNETSAHGFPWYIPSLCEQLKPYSEAFNLSVHRKCEFTGASFHCRIIHRNIVCFIVAKSFEQLIYHSNMFCTMNSHSFLNITSI
jgi:hypothetical protein